MVVVTIGIIFLNSSRATAEQVLVVSCDPPYGYRYVPVLFGSDRLFEINGSSQKELCSGQDSVMTYENGRLTCRYATVATEAIMRRDVADYKRDVEEYNREVSKNRKLSECETYNELDGTSGLSLSCLLSSPPQPYNEFDFYILRETDASIVYWYRNYVYEIEIDFTFRTVSSAGYTISTEQSASSELLLSSVRDGTISRSSLHFLESVSNYRGETCE
jgi:hypothetical protein